MTAIDRAQIIIVGAGISGMATALAIRDQARAIAPAAARPRLLLLEAASRPGGNIRTVRDSGFSCESGANGFLDKEPRTFELCRRLGLSEQLLPAASAFGRRYIYTRGKLRAVSMHPLKFLFSGLLPLGAKVRLVRELWVPPRPAELGDEAVADFARRRIGPVAYQVLVDPMQTGIFAGDPEKMSVASCFPRVVEVEQQYGSLIRGMARLARQRRAAAREAAGVDGDARRGDKQLPGAGPSGHLTSLRGGMQTLIDAFAAELGEELRCGIAVRSVSRRQHGYEVTADGLPGPLRADAVVLACPAHAASAIARTLDDELAAELEAIPYPPMAVVCLGLRREEMPHPLDGFGFLVPRAERMRILGALWTSSIFPERAPAGYVLLRVMIGGARDTAVLELSDEELGKLVLSELRQALGPAGEPALLRVFRHPRAIPQYFVGHGARLERIERRLASLPGLALTGNAYRGIGVNDCARNAVLVAERVLGYLRSEAGCLEARGRRTVTAATGDGSGERVIG